ncbi:MAG: lactate racemase domain-containing protein, partial [Treponema sp.]|nr:lactate racemase domain-containing protein [Treponema sp.]
MPNLSFPYGKEILNFSIPDSRFMRELVSGIHNYKPQKGQQELVNEALAHPLGTPVLHELVKGKKKITIIASDHTRPVPSKIILPPMLAEIRRGNPAAVITILVATGCHRQSTADELKDKFGTEIFSNENIIV